MTQSINLEINKEVGNFETVGASNLRSYPENDKEEIPSRVNYSKLLARTRD